MKELKKIIQELWTNLKGKWEKYPLIYPSEKSMQVAWWIWFGKQYGGFEIRRMNPKLGQRWASPYAERKNLVGQRPESNSSVRKLLLIIDKSGVY